MSQTRIAARWILPIHSPPIENARVVVANGLIAGIESGSSPSDIDYGDAAILPGLVNAHTHLELGRFRGGVPYCGDFTDWLRAVVALQTADGADDLMEEGINAGLAESLAAGVTTIVDNGCGRRSRVAWMRSPANVVGLFEAIGMGPRRTGDHPRSIANAFAEADAVRTEIDATQTDAPSKGMLLTGIAPHAPYSTAPEIYTQAIEYTRTRGLPIGTHLAETREEAEFLARGTGPFRKLLEDRDLWDGSFTPPGCSPVRYAESFGLLGCRPIIAHANYLSDEDIDLLARYRCSVAYCPRTHRFFEHAEHRYRDMLARGANVCLGTDSLASAPTLSILDELRFLRGIDRFCSGDLLLEMGTLRGARAAGLDNRVGSIEPGKRADLVIVPLPSTNAPPADSLLESTAAPIAVYATGRRVHPA